MKGLDGMYCLISKEPKDENAKSTFQGKVVGREDDTILVQTYSWMDGAPVQVMQFSIDVLLDCKRTKLFLELDHMEKEIKRESYWESCYES